MALPKTIYVLEDKDGDQTYLIAYASFEEISEDRKGDMVGVYELKQKKKFTVAKELK